MLPAITPVSLAQQDNACARKKREATGVLVPIRIRPCLTIRMTALKLDSVSKQFGNTVALREVSLTLRAGKITALVGRSGCGKSTLLKLLNGLQTPTSGQVLIDGKPLDSAHLIPHRKRTGYVVQGTGLFPHLSIADNISLLAQTESWPQTDIAERIHDLLTLTQLPPECLDRYPHELSGGQQQRVGLCRAMMLRPNLLLLDEPFAAIDPLTRRDIHAQLLALHTAEPVTSVLVTHDMNEALLLADDIVVMDASTVLGAYDKKELQARASEQDANLLLMSLMQESRQ